MTNSKATRLSSKDRRALFVRQLLVVGLLKIGLLFGTFVLAQAYLFLYGFDGDSGRSFYRFWLEFIPGFVIGGLVYAGAKYRKAIDSK